jgi:hypothetical protein
VQWWANIFFMEKFNDWRDKGTGIHPFLYPLGPNPKDTTQWFLRNGLAPPLAGIKLLLVLILGTVWFLLDLISYLLIVPLVVQSLQFVWNWVLGRTILFLTGFLDIQVRKRKKRGRRELYFANHSSYIDLLLLQIWYQPQFLRVTPQGVQEATFWSMIFGSRHGAAMPLETFVSQSRHRRILLFPEGTTSNGKSILEFQPIFTERVLEMVDVYAIAIKYSWKHWCPCYTTGSFLGHLWGLCSQFSNHVQWIESGRIEPCKNPNEALQKQLSVLSKLPMVRLSMIDKEQFLLMFNKKTR